MKLKAKFVTFFIAISSAFFISTSTASAGECSVADPCLTYAMLNDSGVVINIIVCQPSVCGSGTWDGKKVVPQVAATPEGQNQGGYYNPQGSGREVVHSNGTFTMNNNVPTTNVDVVTNTNNTETSTVVVSISAGNKTTFSYEDTVGKSPSEITFNTLPLENNTSATISATDTNTSSTITESVTFQERRTLEFVEGYLLENNYSLLHSKINRFSKYLIHWFL
jgi:negative regulator of replication initiation